MREAEQGLVGVVGVRWRLKRKERVRGTWSDMTRDAIRRVHAPGRRSHSAGDDVTTRETRVAAPSNQTSRMARRRWDRSRPPTASPPALARGSRDRTRRSGGPGRSHHRRLAPPAPSSCAMQSRPPRGYRRGRSHGTRCASTAAGPADHRRDRGCPRRTRHRTLPDNAQHLRVAMDELEGRQPALPAGAGTADN